MAKPETYSSLLGGELRLEPFPHLISYPALPWSLYRELEAAFPPWSTIVGNRAVSANSRYDINALATLSGGWPKVWEQFVRDHTAPDWWAALREKFATALLLHYPNVKLDGKPGVRFRDKADIDLECQFGVNTPVVVEGTVRGPHVDNPVELLAGLVYFPMEGDDAGGDLVIHKSTGHLRYVGKAEVDPLSRLETVATVPYRPNTGVFFLNTVHSIHSVTSRQLTTKPRRLLNFAVEVHKPLFGLPR